MTLVYFYNLREGRAHTEVSREVLAILADKPVVFGMCEAVGYPLPQVPGYTLIRDRSIQGRANIAAYVSQDQALTRVRWIDGQETWKATQHPGQHAARSILVMRVQDRQFCVAHQPPQFTDNVVAAQQEGITALTQAMASWIGQPARLRSRRRSRLLIWDANRAPLATTGPGPAALAAAIGGSTHGDRIDCAVARNIDAITVDYPTQINGVTLRSDHKHALRLTIS